MQLSSPAIKWRLLLRGREYRRAGKTVRIVNYFPHYRGDHIVPNFAELWPQNNPGMGRKKAVGPEYYQAAMQHHGLSGHLPQPENFTTVGKQPIEINQYNSPMEVR